MKEPLEEEILFGNHHLQVFILVSRGAMNKDMGYVTTLNCDYHTWDGALQPFINIKWENRVCDECPPLIHHRKQVDDHHCLAKG